MAKKKIGIRIRDEETRKTWKGVKEAKKTVAAWPAWKRGEDRPAFPQQEENGCKSCLELSRRVLACEKEIVGLHKVNKDQLARLIKADLALTSKKLLG